MEILLYITVKLVKYACHMKVLSPSLSYRSPWPTLIAATSSIVSALAIHALYRSEAITETVTCLLVTIPVALTVIAITSAWRGKQHHWLPVHRYLMRIAALMAFHIVTLLMVEHIVEGRGLSGWAAFALVLLPGLSFAGVFGVFYMLILEEKDEFQRLLHVRQGLIATSVAFTLAAIWGYLENYGLVEHVAAFWWPVLWCFGIGIGAMANQFKYGRMEQPS